MTDVKESETGSADRRREDHIRRELIYRLRFKTFCGTILILLPAVVFGIVLAVHQAGKGADEGTTDPVLRTALYVTGPIELVLVGLLWRWYARSKKAIAENSFL
jgi:hypothetical protein